MSTNKLFRGNQKTESNKDYFVGLLVHVPASCLEGSCGHLIAGSDKTTKNCEATGKQLSPPAREKGEASQLLLLVSGETKPFISP